MISLLEVLQKSTVYLQDRGVSDAKLSAEWILADALGLKRLDLYLQFERPLAENDLALVRERIRRRAKREPLQYILGSVEFYGVTLKVDSRALIPRPETEYLVELLHTRYLNREPKRLLDLGTGTGAIAIALLNAFPGASALAVDNSEDALELAGENAVSAGVSDRIEFLTSDWFEKVEGAFELILANPPYLTAEEMDSAEPEVTQYEPKTALFAGEDGLGDLTRILRDAPAYLVNGGMLVLETGIRHHEPLLHLVKDLDYVSMESVKDLSRRDRFLIALR